MASSKARRGTRRRSRNPSTSPDFRPTPIVETLIRIHADLESIRARHALVGGLAVSARAEPRTTRDIDLAVGVKSDHEAEQFIFGLQQRGYLLDALIEQTRTKRLSTARFRAKLKKGGEIVVDLLFASSGVEAELVERATQIEILPSVRLPVAGVADLLALKVLARNDRTRPQDADDLRALLVVASGRDRAQVPKILTLIQDRGFARGRRLLEHWKRALDAFGTPPERPGFRRRALERSSPLVLKT